MKTGQAVALVRWLLTLALMVLVLAACAPAMAPTGAPSAPTEAQQPAAEKPVEGTQALPRATASPAGATLPTQPAEPTRVPVIEGRMVELEWPASLRMGDSDVIRLALVPTKEGYVARAEFPEHELQSKPVVVPRPNGYELYALARMDGIGFDIAPTGNQERYVPEGEEVAWRWTVMPRKPGQQRLSVQLRLRWVPGPGVSGTARESQAFARGLDVQVRSFLGMSPTQAASTGILGLLAGCALLVAAVIRARPQPEIASQAKPGALQVIRPGPHLRIETPPGLLLSPEEDGLLRGLFASYARVVIENEFLSGYSGARTFLVRPIRADGCADATTIVKLGPQESIRQEFDNYEHFVKDRLPPMTARIQRPPVVLEKKKRSLTYRAAVQYTFIAEPGRPPVSLRQTLLADPDPGLLLRLFETFGPSWWMQRIPFIFRAGLEYDRLLPPHFVLQPAEPGHRQAEITTLVETANPAALHLQVGQQVLLRPFQQAELRADGHSYSLIGSAQEGHPALRVRWQADRVPYGTVMARVTASRMDVLHEYTAGFERFGLLDPLECLPALLEETIHGTRSVIHGDLNLENVLAGPGSLVWLIDFAQTRQGHPLFDFAHLESELIAHVLAPRCGSSETYLALWQSAKDPLLQAVHEIAGRCLFDPAHRREFYLALYFACLGAMKYQNLGKLAKHCLFLTAGDLVENHLQS